MIKDSILYCFVLVLFIQPLFAQTDFDLFFNDRTMRVDYFHHGNAAEDEISLDHIFVYGQWAGNPAHLIDPFNNGRYYVKLYDAARNQLIYSKGFDSYFAEYRTTAPAIKGIKRTFHESALIPEPKHKCILVLEERQKNNILKPVFTAEIDPADVHIIREDFKNEEKIISVLKNGNPHEKVDVVFLAEGYTQAEFNLFKEDLEKRTDLLFSVEPYKSNKKKFNIYGVFRSSAESGVDEPDKSIYKRTALNSTFYSLDLNRYLLTEDNRTLRDMAASVPYDAIFIMVNSKRYGGGGIYNQFAVFTAHSPATELVFVHEFGHSFAGLADEYYTSTTAYNDFYPKGVEPVEPNITALLDTTFLKWKNEVNPGKAIPSFWNKEKYDSLSIKRQKLRRRLRTESDSKEVEEIKKEMQRLDKKLTDFINYHPLKNKTGFFEGAGYSSNGLYRPMLNCMMFSNREKKFCRVCQKAILRMIHFYSR